MARKVKVEIEFPEDKEKKENKGNFIEELI